MERLTFKDEILFRARNEQGNWILGDLLHGPKQQVYIMEKDTWVKHWIPDVKTICRFTGFSLDGKRIWERDRIFSNTMQECMGTICFGPYSSDFDSQKTGHLGFFVQWISTASGWPDNVLFLRKDLGFWLEKDDIQIL